MRCFISIPLPEEARREMLAIQERLKASGANVSWTRSEGMHLTLKFLGNDVEEKRILEIETALSRATIGIRPFFLNITGMGTFPDIKRPRVIWIGIRESTDNLARLQRGLERELENIGFQREERGFTPHITLGRIRSPKNIEKLLNLIEKEKDIWLYGFDVIDVKLMRSELRPTGAIYSELYSAELKGD